METFTDWSDVPPIEEKEEELENLLAIEEVRHDKQSRFHNRLRKSIIWTATAICIAWITLLVLVALTPVPRRPSAHHWHQNTLSHWDPVIIRPKKSSWFQNIVKTPEKAVVLASYKNQNVTWLENIPDEYVDTRRSQACFATQQRNSRTHAVKSLT